jgi:hypothetical protein
MKNETNAADVATADTSTGTDIAGASVTARAEKPAVKSRSKTAKKASAKTAANSTPKAPKKAAAPAAKKAGTSAPAKKTAGKPAPKAAKAPDPDRKLGRPGSAARFIADKAKLGWGADAIANAVEKEFPNAGGVKNKKTLQWVKWRIWQLVSQKLLPAPANGELKAKRAPAKKK